jgi:hypothetical protein
MQRISLHSVFYILLLTLVSVFTACEKVIEVDLNSSTPQVVIEANLVAGTHVFNVSITETGDYFKSTIPTPINNAVVMLQEENGEKLAIPFISNGQYGKTIVATEGKNYTLTVTIGEKTYTSQSYLPPVVQLDALSLELAPFQGLGSKKDSTYNVYINFSDPAAEGNNYRLVMTVNDTIVPLSEEVVVFNDKNINGNDVNANASFKTFKKGDQISIEMRSIDAKVYDFYFTLSNIIIDNGGFSAAPANPNTNFTGGALGAFIAYSSSSAAIVIP